MAFSNVRAVHLFSTLVMAGRWPSAGEANPQLRDAILRRQVNDPGVLLSNVAGWQSDDAMLDWAGPWAQRLHDEIRDRCDAATADVAQQTTRRFRWRTNIWANVSTRGASNQTHSHPGAYWSAVYYVDDGYAGSTDRALGGELVFLDPRMPMIRARTPDLRFRTAPDKPDSQESWFRPASGMLVIFPSWLLHGVRAYTGPGQRISIALNMTPWPLPAERPG